MYELTFEYSFGSTVLVGRAIKISHILDSIEKIKKALGVNSINIISVDQYNSSNGVYFDKLIDCSFVD